jgi:hypothetical protein
MKKLMNVFLGIMAVVSLAIANSRVAVAETLSGTVTLQNPGFEEPGTGNHVSGWDQAGADIPGWNNATTGTYVGSGVTSASGGSHTGTYGAQLRSKDAGGGGCIQTTGHQIATASDTYTLTFWGKRGNADDGTLFADIYYVDGGGARVTLQSASYNSSVLLSKWSYYQLTLTATATTDSVGKYVGVHFANTTPTTDVWSYVDDVALNYTTNPVPEPSAMVLIGGGLFGLLAYAWRKRRRN